MGLSWFDFDFYFGVRKVFLCMVLMVLGRFIRKMYNIRSEVILIGLSYLVHHCRFRQSVSLMNFSISVLNVHRKDFIGRAYLSISHI